MRVYHSSICMFGYIFCPNSGVSALLSNFVFFDNIEEWQPIDLCDLDCIDVWVLTTLQIMPSRLASLFDQPILLRKAVWTRRFYSERPFGPADFTQEGRLD